MTHHDAPLTQALRPRGPEFILLQHCQLAGACQTCHRWSEDELRARVFTIQDRTFQVRSVAMDALIALITDIKTAKSAGASDTDLQPARRHQRRAQFFLDFIEAENSMGFHADQEAVRRCRSMKRVVDRLRCRAARRRLGRTLRNQLSS